jgi:hypothetical protein
MHRRRFNHLNAGLGSTAQPQGERVEQDGQAEPQ